MSRVALRSLRYLLQAASPQPGRVRLRFVAAGIALAFAVLPWGCGSEPMDADDYLRHCGLRWNVDLPSGEYGHCVRQCILDSTCTELRFNDAKLGWCVHGCGGDFSCDDGDTIISSEWRCDGELDCLDAADEEECE